MAIGRPSKYRKEYAEQARKLCAQLGATEADIAQFLGVATRTVERWKIEHKDFCRALKLGKKVADERVEQSLYRRATGYMHESEKIFQYEGKVVRAKTVEQYPPDTTACIFWLKNRDKANWRDKQELEHSGAISVTISSDDAKL